MIIAANIMTTDAMDTLYMNCNQGYLMLVKDINICLGVH